MLSAHHCEKTFNENSGRVRHAAVERLEISPDLVMALKSFADHIRVENNLLRDHRNGKFDSAIDRFGIHTVTKLHFTCQAFRLTF